MSFIMINVFCFVFVVHVITLNKVLCTYYSSLMRYAALLRESVIGSLLSLCPNRREWVRVPRIASYGKIGIKFILTLRRIAA
jgi:hypothetical protein